MTIDNKNDLIQKQINSNQNVEQVADQIYKSFKNKFMQDLIELSNYYHASLNINKFEDFLDKEIKGIIFCQVGYKKLLNEQVENICQLEKINDNELASFLDYVNDNNKRNINIDFYEVKLTLNKYFRESPNDNFLDEVNMTITQNLKKLTGEYEDMLNNIKKQNANVLNDIVNENKKSMPLQDLINKYIDIINSVPEYMSLEYIKNEMEKLDLEQRESITNALIEKTPPEKEKLKQFLINYSKNGFVNEEKLENENSEDLRAKFL